MLSLRWRTLCVRDDRRDKMDDEDERVASWSPESITAETLSSCWWLAAAVPRGAIASVKMRSRDNSILCETT
jgi:hypothetical protein